MLQNSDDATRFEQTDDGHIRESTERIAARYSQRVSEANKRTNERDAQIGRVGMLVHVLDLIQPIDAVWPSDATEDEIDAIAAHVARFATSLSAMLIPYVEQGKITEIPADSDAGTIDGE